jgi:WD40 repeat protein
MFNQIKNHVLFCSLLLCSFGCLDPSPKTFKVPTENVISPQTVKPVSDAQIFEQRLIDAKEIYKQWLAENPEPLVPEVEAHLFVDSTGQFTTKALVTDVTTDSVSLQKLGSKDSKSVPIEKLSEYDREFVSTKFDDYVSKRRDWDVASSEKQHPIAEAQASLAAYQQKRESESKVAEREAAERERKEAFAARKDDAKFSWPSSKATTSKPSTVKTITVADSWHYQPKTIRLIQAQNIQKAWAAIHSPEDPDLAHIKLIDANGNTVGWSSWLGGTVVYVK